MQTSARTKQIARQVPTTSVLTATTLVYAYRAGITAAAGTRLALCWLLDKLFTLFSFQLENLLGPLLIFLVTTSRCPDWVICAPAAFLGCGSRFSGSLSGIPHPRSVTRQNHGKTIPYHPKLIGQKFERCVAQSAIRKEIVNHQMLVCISNLYHDLRRLVARISSRITTVIRVAYHRRNYSCFTEPFAVSLYNSLILTLAWLSP